MSVQSAGVPDDPEHLGGAGEGDAGRIHDVQVPFLGPAVAAVAGSGALGFSVAQLIGGRGDQAEPSCRIAARIDGANRVYLAHHNVGGYSKAVPCGKAPSE